jgi:hypothetical protein
MTPRSDQALADFGREFKLRTRGKFVLNQAEPITDLSSEINLFCRLGEGL